MGVVLLVPGIILLSTSGWFHDQHTVGLILALIGGGLIALQVLMFAFGAVAFSKAKSRFDRF